MVVFPGEVLSLLATANRIRQASDFSHIVRSGSRSGRRNVVLYLRASSVSDPSRFGFIVGKNIGNAVTRNIVKRRLRSVAQAMVKAEPTGMDIVVRALPAATDALFSELESDCRSARESATKRFSRNISVDREGGRR